MNLTICLDMAGCPNRCKHCWIGHMPNINLSSSDASFVINCFKPYFPNITFYSWLREPDYCKDYKNRWLLDNKLSTGKKPERFELASFYNLVRDKEYVKFLKDVGVKKVQLTLFGLESLTDKYVGRKGAFKEILKATEILISNGIAPRWQVFINEENKNEIPKLIKLIDDLKIKERCKDFELFVHEGSCDGENLKLYDLRIQKGNIPTEVLPYYLDYDKLKTEAELVLDFKSRKNEYFVPSNQGGDITIYVSNTFDVYFNFTNMVNEWEIGNLKDDDIKEICRRIITEDIPALKVARIITLSDLANKFGDSTSKRLFSEDDFKMYLLNKMLKENSF